MPYLTLPPSHRRRDRLIAHPELALGPGWVAIGLIGAWTAWTWPITGILPTIAVLASASVIVAGLLLLASTLAPARTDADDHAPGHVPLSMVWTLERAGWITGISGWLTYGLIVGWASDLIPTLALVMSAVAGLRLVALHRMEAHVRAVTPDEHGERPYA